MQNLFSEQKANHGKQQAQPNVSNDIAGLATELITSLVLILLGGFTMTIAHHRSNPIRKKEGKKRVTLAAVALFCGILLLFLSFKIHAISPMYRIAAIVPGMWLVGFGSTYIVCFLFAKPRDKDRITTEDIFTERPDFSPLYEIFEDPSRIPIGISSKGNSPIYIPINQLLEHSLSSGATGQGKTTRLKTICKHFIRHKRPLIIIDPKGERKDVEQIRQLCKEYGREEAFQLFSLSEKEISCYYNSLKIGDSQQLKSKLMNGLNLTHEYYSALADEFLSAILDAYAVLNRRVTLANLHRYIILPKALSELQREVNALPQSQSVNAVLEMLAAASKIDFKELKGLSAQLASFRALGIVDILNPSSQRAEIDLLNTLQTGGVAYFQMNINGYTAIARAIGALIVQDLKLVSNMLQSEQIARKFDYAFVSIDEMGSFVYPDFSDYIKQVRSASIGLDLSFQGIADVRQISPEFSEQILGNTVNKFVFLQNIPNDVETWSAMAGTKDTIIESYQTENQGIGGSLRTGMGNLHEGKTVLIDFDSVKQLTSGQAIYIDKKRHMNHLISIWDGEFSNSNRKKFLASSAYKATDKFRRITIHKDVK